MTPKGSKCSTKEHRVKVVLEAVQAGDEAVMRKYRIHERTLRRWKTEVLASDDPKLSDVVRRKRAAQDVAWASRIPAAMSACLAFLERAATAASAENPDVIHAIAGAMKMIAETDNTYRFIDARIRGQDGANGAPARPVPAENVTPIRKTG